VAEIVTYTARDGTVLVLSDPSAYLLKSRRGWDVPPVDAHVQRVPDLAGGRYTGTSVRERALALAVEVGGATWDAARAAVGDTLAAFWQGGTFEVTANGRARQLDVEYAGGAEGDTSARRGTAFTLVPEFKAASPYWTDATEAVEVVDLATTATGVALPFALPVFFGTAGFSTAFSLEGGDAPSPWSAAIQGPLSRVQLSRLDTEDTLDITATVAAGELLLLSSAPGERRPRIDTSAGIKDVPGGLSADSTWWLVGPGTTPCLLVVTGTTGRVATFRWHPAYTASN
jgi:hypothetical protein